MGGRFHMLKWCPYQVNKQRKSHTVPPMTKQDLLRELEDDIRKGTLGAGGMVETVVTTPTRGPGLFLSGLPQQIRQLQDMSRPFTCLRASWQDGAQQGHGKRRSTVS